MKEIRGDRNGTMHWREKWSSAMEGVLEQCSGGRTGEVPCMKDRNSAVDCRQEKSSGRSSGPVQLREH